MHRHEPVLFQCLFRLSDRKSARLRSGEEGRAMSSSSPERPGNTSMSIFRQTRRYFIFRHEVTASRTAEVSFEERISTTQREEIQYVTIAFFFRNTYFIFFHFLGLQEQI